MNNKIIQIDRLNFAYDKEPIFLDLNLSIDACDFVAIIGENGSGKSTLLNLILGNIGNIKGKIKLFGKDIKDEKSLRNIAYISQNSCENYRNFPTSIEEVLKVHMSYLKNKKDIDSLLGKVGLKGHKNKALRELSGGQLQRLGLLLALIKDFKLIFLDEPTTGIDEKFSEDFYIFLKSLKNEGKTVVMVTHQLELAEKYVDYAIKIENKSARRIERGEFNL